MRSGGLGLLLGCALANIACEAQTTELLQPADELTRPLGPPPFSLRLVAVDTSSAPTFMMGSPPSEPGRVPTEHQHSVTFTYSWRASDEITQYQFESIMNENPAAFEHRPGHPINNISWVQATAFLDLLSRMEKLEPCYTPRVPPGGGAARLPPALSCTGYRLQTAAEHEYMSRAGDPTSGLTNESNSKVCVGDPRMDDQAIYCNTASSDLKGCVDLAVGGADCGAPHAIRSKAPNAFGLYDLKGNVYEWMHDSWCMVGSEVDPTGEVGRNGQPCDDTIKEKRGGSFLETRLHQRPAMRSYNARNYHRFNVGFRAVRNGLD